jgi:cholest-4-en-3-one 26-monooxygenase
VDLDDIDLNDPDRFQRMEHHEMFRLLRAEDPVHWTEEPNGPGYWSITKHADLGIINRDAEGFSSEKGGVNLVELDDVAAAGSPFDMRGQMMLMTDPPKHTRYRLLVNKGFTPRMIGLIEQHLRYRAELIVDRVIEQGSCDFVTDLAAELPLQAIAEIMGVPQEERHMLFDWSNRMVGADDPEYQKEAGAADGTAAAAELYMYAADLRTKRAGDPRDDVVTKLVNATLDGDQLTDLEFDMFVLLLVVAGNETTRNATAHGMHALLTHPDELAKLGADPALIDSAVEEVLRWATPVLHFRRQATRDLALRDRKIAAGDKVVMWHISANRDEEVFDDPFRFDIERSPNDHIAFGGGGAHYCLGANLARMELRLIFEEVVERMGDLQLAGEPERLRSNFIGGIKHMPVTFSPGPRRHAVDAAA